jgi:hypothetical protein
MGMHGTLSSHIDINIYVDSDTCIDMIQMYNIYKYHIHMYEKKKNIYIYIYMGWYINNI